MSEDITKLPTIQAGFSDLQAFELLQRAGKMLCKSTLVPKEYQGDSGFSNCVIALNMATRMGADPLMVMQNLYIVHNRPSWSSKFLIAAFNTAGTFTSLDYEFFGEENTDSWGCYAFATEKSTGKVRKGAKITIKIAKDEGWYSKNGSKWKTIPQQMLIYRAASFFISAYASQITMGFSSREELVDVYGEERDVTPIAGDVPVNSTVLDAIKKEKNIIGEPENSVQEVKPREPVSDFMATAQKKAAEPASFDMSGAKAGQTGEMEG